MFDEEPVQLAVYAAFASAVTLVLYFPFLVAIRKIPTGGSRNIGAWLCIPFAVCVFGIGFTVASKLPNSKGSWECLICRRQVRRIEVLDCVVSETVRQYAGKPRIDRPESFEEWYWRNVDAPHVHDWFPTGCHETSTWTRTLCGLSGDRQHVYFDVIPLIPDVETAKSLVQKLIARPAGSRYRAIEDFLKSNIPKDDWASLDAEARSIYARVRDGEPWNSLWKGKLMPQEEFSRLYLVWAIYHPDWVGGK